MSTTTARKISTSWAFKKYITLGMAILALSIGLVTLINTCSTTSPERPPEIPEKTGVDNVNFTNPDNGENTSTYVFDGGSGAFHR